MAAPSQRDTACDYGEFGGYEEALGLLETCSEKDPMCCYYQAYFQALLGRGAKAQQLLVKAEGLPAGCCFVKVVISLLLSALMEESKPQPIEGLTVAGVGV